MQSIYRPLVCRPVALLILGACLIGCSTDFDRKAYLHLADQYSVTIERDNLGVPHVLGDTDEDTAFGFAWAQAEDNWPIMQKTLATNRGVRARTEGADAAISDFLVRWLNIWNSIEAGYETQLSADTRSYVEAFADGLNYYAAAHPELTDLELFPVSGKDIVAGYMFRHTLFYGLNDVLTELNGPERARNISGGNGVAVNGVPVGSNAIAVAPRYTDDGSTYLAINSHQPTTGPAAWYEAHIKSEEGLDILGGLFPGSPTISLGYTKNLGWAVTVNKPDMVDVYVLEVDPENPHRYRLDGEWRDFEVEETEIEVLLWGFLPWSSSQTLLRSVHGPVLQTDHGTYAVRYAGMGEMRQVEQWMAMNRARNFDEWRTAMRQHRFASFNFVYADASGNIMLVHNSQTPIRKEGYDWLHYLPGDDSSLIWSAHLPFDDLPQVVNPASGYVLSANQNPFQVSAPEDNPDPANYSATAGFQTRVTNRTNRGLELLDELGPISEQDFFAIKHDKKYSPRSRAGQYLQAIAELDTTADAQRYQDAQDIIANWNLSTDINNTGAALGVCMISKEWEAEQQGKPAPAHRDELIRCTDLLLGKTGRLDPPWGEVNRHIRGPINLPVGGGPDTLRAIYGRGLEEDGYLTNVGGDGLYYLLRWHPEEGLTARGVHHFGSATLDEHSPHYADQATDFAKEVLHDPLLSASARAPHITRRYAPGRSAASTKLAN